MSIGAQSRSQLQECGHKASWATLNGLCSQVSKIWCKTLKQTVGYQFFVQNMSHFHLFKNVTKSLGWYRFHGWNSESCGGQEWCPAICWRAGIHLTSPTTSTVMFGDAQLGVLFVSTQVSQGTENPCRVNVEIIRSFLGGRKVKQSRHSQPFRNFTPNVSPLVASCDCPMAEPFQSKQVSYATVKIPCSESPWPEYIWVLLWNLQLSPSMAMVSGAENFNCKFRIKMYEVQLLWLITSCYVTLEKQSSFQGHGVLAGFFSLKIMRSETYVLYKPYTFCATSKCAIYNATCMYTQNHDICIYSY